MVLDTNVFLLAVVGLWRPELLDSKQKIKRLESYSGDDFLLLLRLIQIFGKKWITTPSIIAETCNLLDGPNKGYNFQIFQNLAVMLRDTLRESGKPSKELSAQPAFLQFGLADASLIDLAKRNYCSVEKLGHA
jgi:hypothetical protein